MVLRSIAIILVLIWLILFLLGKGGFVHVLILTATGIAFVDLLYSIRAREFETNEQNPS
ncbi:MAG TPA: hypothetical protein VNK26_02475 [Pyrinomonadaceae bacterium]|nr:hypothetical protein [Pyrinomonadaceae bacterium]